jgi:hypothetical protein
MLELWNNWYDTLASVEALATVHCAGGCRRYYAGGKSVGGDTRPTKG